VNFNTITFLPWRRKLRAIFVENQAAKLLHPWWLADRRISKAAPDVL